MHPRVLVAAKKNGPEDEGKSVPGSTGQVKLPLFQVLHPLNIYRIGGGGGQPAAEPRLAEICAAPRTISAPRLFARSTRCSAILHKTHPIPFLPTALLRAVPAPSVFKRASTKKQGGDASNW